MVVYNPQSDICRQPTEGELAKPREAGGALLESKLLQKSLPCVKGGGPLAVEGLCREAVLFENLIQKVIYLQNITKCEGE